MEQQKKIKFYKVSSEYGFMSNFALFGFADYKGEYWPTSEHFFQAQKFKDQPEKYKTIQICKHPGDAARLGRSMEMNNVMDWKTHLSEYAMQTALFLKFTQHPELAKKLIDTGDTELIEDSPKDYIWGIGADGTGKNLLGKTLMNLRDILKVMVRA